MTKECEKIINLEIDDLNEYMSDNQMFLVADVELYKCIYDNSLEDSLFVNVDISMINKITLEALKAKNYLALDYIVNNANELMFNIDSTIKNRSFLEVALFFNDDVSIKILLNNDIGITSRLSNSCQSWITDNYAFLSNPMHDKHNDKEWISSFVKVLEVLGKFGWPEIAKTSKNLLLRNQKVVYSELKASKIGKATDYNRIIELIMKLPESVRDNIARDISSEKK